MFISSFSEGMVGKVTHSHVINYNFKLYFNACELIFLFLSDSLKKSVTLEFFTYVNIKANLVKIVFIEIKV